MSTHDSDTAFALLTGGVQRQLYKMRWTSLRPVQVDAIRAYLQSQDDLLITAETAGGKTEAAFLPVLSAISTAPTTSVRALYVGPLKALINDQFGRIEELCAHLEVPVHRWHGDVGAGPKAGLIRNPGGVLLITPESIESLLVNRTRELPRVFSNLSAIVVDELHAFLEGERGLHLASLLQRLRRYCGSGGSGPRMIGLSATIGDVAAARQFLRPRNPEKVRVIASTDDQPGLEIRVHGYLQLPEAEDPHGEANCLITTKVIAEDLVEHCRTHSNLIFANAKADIEVLADLANSACKRAGLPEGFLVHHGSLSRELRESAEELMRRRVGMTTICSSTLEMGLDIGTVRMVGQFGPPWSVSCLKQRLGRSGRRSGEPRRLRCYVIHEAESGPIDSITALPLDLLQTVAVIELMLEGWIEPPQCSRCDLSTLAQQVISVICERGAATKAALFEALCQEGPFTAIGATRFGAAIESLRERDVLELAPDGKLILGLVGEKLRARRDYYAAFVTPEEYTLVAGRQNIGSLPMRCAPVEGQAIHFAGRRWSVTAVDCDRLRINLTPSATGGRPRFCSEPGEVHRVIRERMAQCLLTHYEPRYLDQSSLAMLRSARALSAGSGIGARGLQSLTVRECIWWTWTGTREQRTLLALLADIGVSAADEGVAIRCRLSASDLRAQLDEATTRPIDRHRLAQRIEQKVRRKHDALFPPSLLAESIAEDAMADVVLSQFLGNPIGMA